MGDIYLGIDIGGSNVKYGLIDKYGNILFKSAIKIGICKTPEIVVEKTAKDILRNIEENKLPDICGVGVGVPGLIDSERGVVVRSGNLDWNDVDLVSLIKKYFSVPIKIANDANVATLGEVKFGKHAPYKNCVMLTLGTGVGSGIVIDGKIYSGKASAGAELGHMVIEAFGRSCTCGGSGCFEAYASATALKEQTKKAMLSNTQSKMWEVGTTEDVSAKTAFLYSDKDICARKVIDDYIDYLAIGIVNIANIFRPDAIILGGGVSNEGEKLLYPLNKKLSQKIFAGDKGPKVDLVLATLRNDAGFMGAAALNMGE